VSKTSLSGVSRLQSMQSQKEQVFLGCFMLLQNVFHILSSFSCTSLLWSYVNSHTPHTQENHSLTHNTPHTHTHAHTGEPLSPAVGKATESDNNTETHPLPKNLTTLQPYSQLQNLPL